MRVLWIVIATVIAGVVSVGNVGCGRFGFDSAGDDTPGGGTGDGGTSDGSSTGDGSTGGDAGTDATQSISPGCGTTILINDDFGDGTMGSQWTMVASSGYSVVESGGSVAVTFPGVAAANTRAGYRQSATVPFTNTCAIAELAVAPTGVTAYAYVRLGTPTLNVELIVENGLLSGKFTNGGTSGSVGGAVPFVPSSHRFLRIRNVNGTYNFEAGPSLTQFTTSLGSQGGAIISAVSPSSLEIGGGMGSGSGANPGTATFASVTFLAQ